MDKANKKPYPCRDVGKSEASIDQGGLSKKSLEADDEAPNSQNKLIKENLSPTVLAFFSLFHGWDCISAFAVRDKPDWVTLPSNVCLPTLSLYKKWANPNELIGVRFPNGRKKTSYFLVDVDTGSAYHPDSNYQNFVSLLNTLSQVGLFGHIIVRSSFSGGLHVYYPLPEPVQCYKLAQTIEAILINGKFSLKAGQIEVFPNVKIGRVNYKPHRLPLQLGSCVLDEYNFEPIHADLNTFITAWNNAAGKQDLQLFRNVLETTKPVWKGQGIQAKSNLSSFQEDLEKVLETGWTGPHQTNDIIKDACKYARVFVGLDWNAVESWVLQEIPKLPGFQEFCAHRHNYQRRVRDWVRANRRSNRHYPCSQRSRSSKPPSEPTGPNNQAKAQDALQRIQEAIARLQTAPGGLPNTVKERQNLICREARCSAATLRKHLSLWHPRHLADRSDTSDAPGLASSTSPSCASGEISPIPGQECVTAQPVRVSGDFGKDLATVAESAETSQNQGVTHSATLRCSNLVQQTLTPIDTSQAIGSTHHQQELLQQMQGLKLVEPPGKVVA